MMPAVAECIARAESRLASVSETPRLDAELILAHAMGISRASLLARLREQVPALDVFESLLRLREKSQPLAYLFGRWEFFSLEFEIEPPALVPRPETEHLVETVLDFIGDSPPRVLDLCTGTGCVAVAIAVNAPRAHVVAADIEARYVALARRNAAHHGAADRVDCRQGDLFAAVKHAETFDVVCANPPYVETAAWEGLAPVIRDFEDPRALLAGEDGLDVITRIAQEAADHLRPGGLLALEIGHRQAPEVERLLTGAGFRETRFVQDLAGIDRIAVGFAQDVRATGPESPQEIYGPARP